MKNFAVALDRVRASRSRTAKEHALAEAFAAIASAGGDADRVDLALATAARLASGRTLPVGDGRTTGVGWALVSDLALEVTGEDASVLRACARRAGDLGEAFGLLLARIDGAGFREGVPLVDVAGAFDALAATSGRAGKLAILRTLYARATPLETKYLTRALLASLRIGAQGGVVEAAIAHAFARPPTDVRRALALTGDPGIVIALARADRLAEASFAIGRPVEYMLATPIETLATPVDPSSVIVEDKIDGVRAQVHKSGDSVSIFARGLERVTGAFPEVRDAFAAIEGDVALDGELVALAPGGRPRPFQALQTRLNRERPTAEMLEATPVTFIAYDLLADSEGSHLELPWTERRARLDAFARERAPGEKFAVTSFAAFGADGSEVPFDARIDAAYAAARDRGNEGVVLKRTDALYEAGRRGSAWIKVKRAFATLDVVVTAVQEGSGKRAGMLSDYTFAVWRGDDLVNVGKAYSGLTDAEIAALQVRFERSTLERRGPVRLVKPEVVLEVGFDGLQRSARHGSGFALRFPRIHRIRDDKTAAEADRLEAVEALFATQVETGHREDAAPDAPSDAPPDAPSDAPPERQTRARTRPKGEARERTRKAANTAGIGVSGRQLGLFDLDPPRPAKR